MKREAIQQCPICGNSSKVIAIVPTIDSREPDKVELRSCDSCGHWWHSPVPNQEELNKLYQSASPLVVSPGAKESYQNKTELDHFHKYVLKHMNKKPGNYLEIGAGGGGLLNRFRAMNFICCGVDPGQWVQDPAIVNSVDELPHAVPFDIFVLQDVLEHVFDPVGLLVKLKRMARENSIFFCSFPCKDSRPARIYKGKWSMVRPYGHLHYFSFPSAAKMFSLAGLTVNDIRSERITPISKTILSLHIRSFIYEILKGGTDQFYVQASA
jgi:hypothetical protein